MLKDHQATQRALGNDFLTPLTCFIDVLLGQHPNFCQVDPTHHSNLVHWDLPAFVGWVQTKTDFKPKIANKKLIWECDCSLLCNLKYLPGCGLLMHGSWHPLQQGYSSHRRGPSSNGSSWTPPPPLAVNNHLKMIEGPMVETQKLNQLLMSIHTCIFERCVYVERTYDNNVYNFTYCNTKNKNEN